MRTKPEHSPCAANPSNASVARALRCVAKACRLVAERGDDARDDLLDLALMATGAERAFLVLAARCDDGSFDPAVEHFRARSVATSRDLSRTVTLAALARDRPFVALDAEADPRLTDGASVRDLALRAVIAAPLPQGAGDSPRLLVLDRRCGPVEPGAEWLGSVAAAFAALLAAGKRRGEAGARVTESDFTDAAGRSAVWRRTLDWADRAARSELAVLVCGETGSGKEGIARRIHRKSRRRDGPFVAVNCTALPDTLLDAELFGSARGSYTGADRDRPGLFRLAHGGSLLLDEVGDMSPPMQAKLLRALEERRVRPIGGESDVPVDVRIVAATNRDLEADARHARFRADLYYRLAVVQVDVPPLRERMRDLVAIVRALAPRLAHETGLGRPRPTAEAWRLLRERAWPGNVRELHATLARALLRSQGARIEAVHLVEDLPVEDPAVPRDERALIERALLSGRSISAAAFQIGWTRQKLYRRMRALGMRAR